MSFRTLLFTGLLFWVNVSSAQTFVPVAGALLQQEVEFEQANECYMIFDNPSGSPLTLRWRSLEVSMPDGWDVDLCDYGLCYSGIPGNGIMNAVSGATQPYLKLIVQPGTVEGAAWFWFRVWEDGNETNFVDVYFSLHTPGTTGATAAAITPWRFFPNPARDRIVLDNLSTKAADIRLVESDGRVVLQKSLPPFTNETLYLPDLPPGTYFLQDGSQTKTLFIQP